MGQYIAISSGIKSIFSLRRSEDEKLERKKERSEEGRKEENLSSDKVFECLAHKVVVSRIEKDVHAVCVCEGEMDMSTASWKVCVGLEGRPNEMISNKDKERSRDQEIKRDQERDQKGGRDLGHETWENAVFVTDDLHSISKE